MSRYYLRMVLIVPLIFAAALWLIRSQPYDDHGLRAILIPEGCSAPCFMGIRPGVTTKEAAFQILQRSTWVKHYNYQEDARIIRLTWGKNAPAWLVKPQGYATSFIAISGNVVSEIHLDTQLTLADMQLIFGASLHQKVYMLYQQGYTLLSYSALYPQKGVFASTFNDCAGASNSITYEDTVSLGYTQLGYMSDLPHQYNSTWADLLHASCKRG